MFYQGTILSERIIANSLRQLFRPLAVSIEIATVPVTCSSTKVLHQPTAQRKFKCPAKPLLNLQYVIDAETSYRGDLFRHWPSRLFGMNSK